MHEFVAEQYFSRTDVAGAGRARGAAQHAAEELASDGVAIEFVRSIFVPEDETCIFIYEADSLEIVQLSAERGGLAFDRILQAAAEPEDAAAANADAGEVSLP
jgi:Nickel responsive protein SCO4226-like